MLWSREQEISVGEAAYDSILETYAHKLLPQKNRVCLLSSNENEIDLSDHHLITACESCEENWQKINQSKWSTRVGRFGLGISSY